MYTYDESRLLEGNSKKDIATFSNGKKYHCDLSASYNVGSRYFTQIHKAFTLIELIIVVIIISMVSFMVFSEVVKETKRPENIDPLKLPKTLRETYPYHEDIEFFCIQKCRDCYIAKGSEILPFNGNINLGSELEVYTVDRNNQLVQIEDFGRIKDHKICIRFTLYANGSTTQMILSNSEGVYYLPTYFDKPKMVDDLDEAKALWIKDDYNLKDTGNYY